MVSKVAVMALVAVIAVPILLGYALNLSEQTVTEYKPDGDSVNVTELLQTGTAYTSANADAYNLNSEFTFNGTYYIPVYNKIGSTYSSIPRFQTHVTVAAGGSAYWRLGDNTEDFYLYVGENSNVTFNRLDSSGNVVLATQAHVAFIHYNKADGRVEVGWFYSGNGGSYYYTPGSTSEFVLFRNDGASSIIIDYSIRESTTSTYVDLSGGFYVQSHAGVQIPDKSKSLLMTVDLDSITSSSFKCRYLIGQVSFVFEKTTTGGIVSWKATEQQSVNGILEDVNEIDLYYNPSGSNVYQILVTAADRGTDVINGTTYYITNWHSELRYVGSWPTFIGYANYYMKYEYDLERQTTFSNQNEFSAVSINVISGSRSLSTRIDAAEFRAFAYSIITDTTYNPGDFKTNPSTTLTVQKFGRSLEFAGNTYTVDSSGNITLGTHKVSVNGLQLESVPTAGGYANKINGTTISVTADPSTIRFNGNWGASVSTVANAASSYTHTEWTAGEFGWDGIDHNFLIVGLLTSLGAFIALGIYIRRTKAALWPLLIVCGGAAMLFFCML